MLFVVVDGCLIVVTVSICVCVLLLLLLLRVGLGLWSMPVVGVYIVGCVGLLIC